MPKLKPVARQAAEDWALLELRSAILSATLPPGARLRQENLASQMGVSRMPIRQALLALEREGLVRTDRWHGTVVTPLDPDLIRDTYAFRAVIERYVAETLARRPDFDSSSIRQVVASGRKAIATGQLNRVIELDLRFHTMLYESVGNQVLSAVMQGQWAHIKRVMAVTLTVPQLRERVWDEHASILNAIDRHDSTQAAVEAEAHMNAARTTLLEQLGSASGPDMARPTTANPATRRKSERGRLSRRKPVKRARARLVSSGR